MPELAAKELYQKEESRADLYERNNFVTSCLFLFIPNPFWKWDYFNPTALRMAKTPQSTGHSECNMVKRKELKNVFLSTLHLTREAKTFATSALGARLLVYKSFFILYMYSYTQHFPIFPLSLRENNDTPKCIIHVPTYSDVNLLFCMQKFIFAKIRYFGST